MTNLLYIDDAQIKFTSKRASLFFFLIKLETISYINNYFISLDIYFIKLNNSFISNHISLKYLFNCINLLSFICKNE